MLGTNQSFRVPSLSSCGLRMQHPDACCHCSYEPLSERAFACLILKWTCGPTWTIGAGSAFQAKRLRAGPCAQTIVLSVADQGSAPERKEAVCSVQKGRVCDMPNGDRSYTGYSPGEGLNARLEKDSESKMEQSYERDTARRQVAKLWRRRNWHSPS